MAAARNIHLEFGLTATTNYYFNWTYDTLYMRLLASNGGVS
jgi:hypothetical protein